MAQLSPRMQELLQPHLTGIEPYDPNFTPTPINLSANENTYPLPGAARDAISAALSVVPFNRYPDPMSNSLRDELARWHGVSRDAVCVGNGGDELLYNFLLAFGGEGRTLLTFPPDFSEYAFFASLTGAEVKRVWRDPETFEIDADAAVQAAATSSLVILTSPNNPTGNLADVGLVERICEACPGLVMVDEAYGEFAPGRDRGVCRGTADLLGQRAHTGCCPCRRWRARGVRARGRADQGRAHPSCRCPARPGGAARGRFGGPRLGGSCFCYGMA